MSKIFIGCFFVLELGQVSLREKNTVKRLIEDNGGSLHQVLTKQTTCLVLKQEGDSFKTRTAKKLQVAIVTDDYLHSCERKQKHLDRFVLALDGKIENADEELSILQDKEQQLVASLAEGVMNIAAVASSGLSSSVISSLRTPLSLYQLTRRFYKSSNLTFDESKTEDQTKHSFVGEHVLSAEQVRHEREKEYQKRLIEEGNQQLLAEKQFWKQKREKEKRDTEFRLQRETEERAIKEKEEKRKREREEALIRQKEEREAKAIQEAEEILSKMKEMASLRSALPPLVPKKWLVLMPKTVEDKKKFAEEAKEAYSNLLFPSQTTFMLGSNIDGTEPPPAAGSEPTEPQPAVRSFVDVVRNSLGLPPSINGTGEEQKEEEKEEEKKPIISFAGFKIYYSGIKFLDIDAKATDENEPWAKPKIDEVKNERKKLFLQVYCEKFGNIVEVQEHWDEGYIFVVFDNKADAKSALDTLQDFKTRKALAKEARAQLISEKKEKLITPNPAFYVRWPKFYQKILKQRKDKKNKKPPTQNLNSQSAKPPIKKTL